MRMTESKHSPPVWIGPLIFMGTLLLYLSTASKYAYPGSPAAFAVRCTGCAPYSPYSHGLWTYVASWLAILPFGTLVLKLSALSALCGALTVYLMYAIHVRIKHDKSTEETLSQFNPAAPQLITGLVAAAVLAVSIPFWVVANRPHPLAFDVLLLLAAVYCLLRYDQSRRPPWLYVAALIWGVGIADFPTFVIISPFFGAYAIVSVLAPPCPGQTRSATFLSRLESLLREPGRFASCHCFLHWPFSFWALVRSSHLPHFLPGHPTRPLQGWTPMGRCFSR